MTSTKSEANPNEQILRRKRLGHLKIAIWDLFEIWNFGHDILCDTG